MQPNVPAKPKKKAKPAGLTSPDVPMNSPPFQMKGFAKGGTVKTMKKGSKRGC